MKPTRDKVLTWKRRGWSAAEIAVKLGVSKPTVYYHLHRLQDEGRLNGAVKAYRKRSR